MQEAQRSKTLGTDPESLPRTRAHRWGLVIDSLMAFSPVLQMSPRDKLHSK